jgi:hypothetical protein
MTDIPRGHSKSIQRGIAVLKKQRRLGNGAWPITLVLELRRGHS